MLLSLSQLVLTYMLGLLTVPVLIAAGVLVFWLTSPDASNSQDQPDASSTCVDDATICSSGVGAGAQAPTSPYGGRRTGWLHITRSLGRPPSDSFDGQTKLTDMVARGISKWIHGKRSDTGRPGSSASDITLTDNAQDLYYVVLDGDTLVMYDGEAMSECRGVIIMSKHRVSLYHHKDVTEAQVYSRRTPIKLSPMNDGIETSRYKRQVADYYIYADKPTEKEDWYFALMWSSLASIPFDESDDSSDDVHDKGGESGNVGPTMPGSLSSDPHAANEMGQGNTENKDSLDGEPELTEEKRARMRLRMRRSCMIPDYSGTDAIFQTISKRGTLAKDGAVREDEWLNAILGRIFIGVYKTEWVRQHFIHRLQSKFDRVQRPVFLDRIVVADLDIGDHVPVITEPKLESFDTNGQVDMSMFMHYMGGFKLVLDTAVKFGSLRLTISLSVVLESLAGKMLLRFKPAPSNRFWIAFYEMPRIRLKLSPVFMQKHVKYAAVSQAIEKQIYDMLRLSLVLPNLDDTVFFPASFEDGGILERSLKEYNDAGLAKETASENVQLPTEPNDVKTSDCESNHTSVLSQDNTSAKGQANDLSSVQLSRASMSMHSSSDTAPSQAGIAGNSCAAAQESRSASRFSMTTPNSISDRSVESGQGSLDSSNTNGIESATSQFAKPPHTRSALTQPMMPVTKAPSIKSTISTSAATFFKRAKDSQAAESARTWWQGLQQNGLGGNSNSSHQRSSSTIPEIAQDNAKALGESEIQHRQQLAGNHSRSDSSQSMAGRSQSLSPRLPQNAHISTPPRAVTSNEADSSKPFKFPQLTDNRSHSGGTSSSFYDNRSSMISDSLLVRRRPAAQSYGSDIEMPIPRQNSKFSG
ncbi:hypothetical protein COEREDRAFT_79103 [Coemansia reversa NRRL 1564]|uniref:SMP-LTD domain-containing protein n=1 Tax=Coemansia reversa (strain ATCC 12441 / NRRL 1564) TaxID=763665 RepID=A0A2G5BK58_COERN|nr:hypothetical protein COEREDRAFT_79103 [Coemansia reversa NRRL 1564]|eukprot:PIA19127.1 hypothetical protein COEREDRAFT_79103 [Coemansia reversa NRRL 1564]